MIWLKSKLNYKYKAVTFCNGFFIMTLFNKLLRQTFWFLLLNLSSTPLISQVFGCTDPLATNFNSLATLNNGSCIYAQSSISPSVSLNLTDSLIETSGLVFWGNSIVSHNDNSDNNLYFLDTVSAVKTQTIKITGAVNQDWEELSQDENYVYIGDFGNNSGNRTNLKILKISKSSILNNSPIIDSIKFSYSNQVNFVPATNNTDFDCEAFIINNDSIYLFTKQWISNKTGIYSLPKTPGTYTANLRGTIDTQGLITGATSVYQNNLVVLCGYNTLFQPFLFLLYDYSNNDFTTGNKRRIGVTLPFHQIEGVATKNGTKYFLSNEKYFNGPINVLQKLHIIDLSSFLSEYLIDTFVEENDIGKFPILLYPNPCTSEFIFNAEENTEFELINSNGLSGLNGKLINGENRIDIQKLSPGIYIFSAGNSKNKRTYRVIRK